MKITFIATLQNYWGGSEFLWVKTAQYAVKEKHEIQVLVYKQTGELHPMLEELKKVSSSFVLMPNSVLTSSLISKLIRSIKNKLIKFDLKEVVDFKPDQIVVNQVNNYSAPFHPGIFNLLSNNKLSYFLISQFNSDHECLSYDDILKSRLIFNNARQIFFVSKRNKDVTERQLAKAIDNATIIDNPVNINQPKYIDYPSDQDVINFASVARFEVNFKGQDILLQVLSQSKWKERKWHLNFYGTGPDEAYLRDLCKFYDLDNFVTFHGHVSDLNAVWEINQALLFPSIAEGKPLALIEAMICGRIGIVSDVAGNAELVDHEVNGFVASSYFPKPFDDVLEQAWQKRIFWKEMGVKAHRKVMESVDLNPERTLFNMIKI